LGRQRAAGKLLGVSPQQVFGIITSVIPEMLKGY
jgi:hypothetical protein